LNYYFLIPKVSYLSPITSSMRFAHVYGKPATKEQLGGKAGKWFTKLRKPFFQKKCQTN